MGGIGHPGDVRDGEERLQRWSQAGVRVVLYFLLIVSVVEIVAGLVVVDLWSLPLSAYYAILSAVLIRRRAWRWDSSQFSLRAWLSRPRNLALVGVGVACFAVAKAGDVRREGELVALAPIVGVLVLFAVCYAIAVPVEWVVWKYRLRRDKARGTST